jgi:hypothetical protein
MLDLIRWRQTFSPVERFMAAGSPIPYVFFLVVEGLSSMLRGVESRGKIEGVRVCHDAPTISKFFIGR